MVDIAAADPRTILAVRHETLGYVSQFLRVVPRVLGAGHRRRGHADRGIDQTTLANGPVRLLLETQYSRTPARNPAGHLLRRRAAAVNLARGFIAGHPILLLDEPTASLDAENRAVVIDMVRDAKANGTAIVAICHDADVRDAIADRLFTMTPYQDAA